MINLTDDNFNQEILENKKTALIDFWMDGCPPCSLVSPILEKMEDKFSSQALFAKVNVGQAPLAAQKYGVNAVPTIILFKEGEPISGFVGFQAEEKINLWLEENLKKNEKSNK